MTGKQRLEKELVALQASHVRKCGVRFDHFFCPALWEDTPSELCLGHVFNQSFGHHKRRVVVQRKDVDEFYGKFFEFDVRGFAKTLKKDMDEIVESPELVKYQNFTMFVDNKPVKTLIYDGNMPDGFSKVGLLNSKGKPCLTLAVDVHPDKWLPLKGTNRTRLHSFNDWRLEVLPTLIKSAHLSMFYVFQYRYGISVASDFIGRQILGRFYRHNCNGNKHSVHAAAKEFFIEYVNVARPVLGEYPRDMLPSIENRVFYFLEGSSGQHFGIGAIVKTGPMLHMVYMPNFLDPSCDVGVYQDFISNDNEDFTIRRGRWNEADNLIELDSNLIRIKWPKNERNKFAPIEPSMDGLNNPSDWFSPPS